MPPEGTNAPESPSPTIESPAPATEPAPPPQEASPATTAPEAPPAPVEASSALETDQSAPQTGQTEGNEPLATKPDSIPPPSTAASQAQPIIVPPTGNFIRNLLAKASAKIQSKKKARLEKIMAVLNMKSKITNDEIEKLLRVSDATATRYLSALAKEGKIKQVGKTGTGVVYQKI
jgi:hypothetical protein